MRNLRRALTSVLRRRPAAEPASYPEGPLRTLAASSSASPDTAIADVDFLVVDLETTGLDPRQHHVLSIGWVPVRRRQVVLAEAREIVVRPPLGEPVGDSAVIHGLTDDALAEAPSLIEALPDLLGALAGHVLVAHHSPIEVGFLGRAAQEAYGSGLPLTVVDTMSVQRELETGVHGEIWPDRLRLDDARRGYGLPRYRAHRAVTDAIATAELLLAQVAELEHRLGRDVVLRDLGVSRRPRIQ